MKRVLLATVLLCMASMVMAQIGLPGRPFKKMLSAEEKVKLQKMETGQVIGMSARIAHRIATTNNVKAAKKFATDSVPGQDKEISMLDFLEQRIDSLNDPEIAKTALVSYALLLPTPLELPEDLDVESVVQEFKEQIKQDLEVVKQLAQQ